MALTGLPPIENASQPAVGYSYRHSLRKKATKHLPGQPVTLTQRETRIIWLFMLGATVSELIAAMFMFRPKDSWFDTLWSYASTPPGTTPAWALAFLVMASYVVRSTSRSPVIRAYAFSPAQWLPFLGMRFFALLMALVTGFFEESFFRKTIMDMMQLRDAGLAMQLLSSAIIFGIVHAIWVIFGGKFRAAAAIMLTTGVLGGLRKRR